MLWHWFGDGIMGILYLVPTPVGNMDDITLRALRVLREADLILAEDTRRAGVLLAHFEVRNAVLSYHKFNEHQVTSGFIRRLRGGETVALVTDAGTPGISDPGFLIVRQAVEEGIEVVCLPGATAFVPALVDSGLPCDRFVMEGFLPVRKGRGARLEELRVERRTMVFYESPHRLVRTLAQFVEAFGGLRRASVSREISKVYEETLRGSLEELLRHFEGVAPRGEFVVVVEGCGKGEVNV